MTIVHQLNNKNTSLSPCLAVKTLGDRLPALICINAPRRYQMADRPYDLGPPLIVALGPEEAAHQSRWHRMFALSMPAKHHRQRLSHEQRLFTRAIAPRCDGSRTSALYDSPSSDFSPTRTPWPRSRSCARAALMLSLIHI